MISKRVVRFFTYGIELFGAQESEKLTYAANFEQIFDVSFLSFTLGQWVNSLHLYIKPEASKARGILFLAINVGEMEFEDKMHFTTTYLYRPGTISKD